MISNAQLGRAVLELATDSATFYADLGKAEQRMAALKKGIEGAGGSFSGFSREATQAGEGVGLSFAKMIGAVALGTAAFETFKEVGRTVMEFFGSTVDAAVEAEDAITRLSAALKTQGTYTPELVSSYQEMSQEFQRTTKYSHDAVEGVMGTLIQLGNIAPENMGRALQATLDLSSGLGRDLEPTAQAVAKALGGNTTALSKLIPEIKLAGDEAKTTDGLLRILAESGFGGQAAAAVTTYSGRVAQLKNAWSDFKEELGFAITKNDALREALGKLTGWLSSPEAMAFTTWFGRTLTDAISSAQATFARLSDWLASSGLGAALSAYWHESTFAIKAWGSALLDVYAMLSSSYGEAFTARWKSDSEKLVAIIQDATKTLHEFSGQLLSIRQQWADFQAFTNAKTPWALGKALIQGGGDQIVMPSIQGPGPALPQAGGGIQLPSAPPEQGRTRPSAPDAKALAEAMKQHAQQVLAYWAAIDAGAKGASETMKAWNAENKTLFMTDVKGFTDYIVAMNEAESEATKYFQTQAADDAKTNKAIFDATTKHLTDLATATQDYHDKIALMGLTGTKLELAQLDLQKQAAIKSLGARTAANAAFYDQALAALEAYYGKVEAETKKIDWFGGLGEAGKVIAATFANINSSIGQYAQLIGNGLEQMGKKGATVADKLTAGFSTLAGVLAQLAGENPSKLMSSAIGGASGAAAGAGIGFMFGGPTGAGIGAAIGGLAGAFSGWAIAAKQEREANKAATEQIKTYEAELLKTYGSLENIHLLAPLVGFDLTEAWGDQSQEGLKHFKSYMDQLNATMNDTRAALDAYGLSWLDTGQTMRQFTIAQEASKLATDYTLLITAGVPAEKATKGMSAALNQLILDAVKSGQKIPQSMSLMIDTLVRTGQVSTEAARALMGFDDAATPSIADITAAAERYGLTLDQLGPKVTQLSINETSKQVIADWDLLQAAGADTNTVMSGMSASVQDLVTKALQLGLELPESMQPLIEDMTSAGLLTDANGDKLTDLGKLKFAEDLTKQFQTLLDKISELIDTLTGEKGLASTIENLPKNVGVTVTRTVYDKGYTPGGEPTGDPAVDHPDTMHVGGIISRWHQGGVLWPGGAALARAHTGMYVGRMALAADEVPIIAQTQEGILSRVGMRTAEQWLNTMNSGIAPKSGSSGGPAGDFYVDVPIAVEGQVLARALVLVKRRNRW